MTTAPSIITLPPPPRPLAGRAAARSFTEPRVRGWWMAFAGLVLVAGYFVIGQYRTWRADGELLSNGRVVQAKVDGAAVAASLVPPETRLNLSYVVDGKAYAVSGYLPGRKEYVKLGTTVPIRVDAANPARWTGRTTPAPLAASLVAAWTLLPLILLSLAGGLWARRRVARAYRLGAEVVATVVDTKQPAIAPASRLVRCTLPDRKDRRVYTVYVPHATGRPQPGDEFPVLHLPGSCAVAAAWFGG